MKILLTLIFFLSFSCFAELQTISKDEIIGTWSGYQGFDDAQTNSNASSSLIITPDLNVAYIRGKENGVSRNYTATNSEITFTNDVIIIPLKANGKVMFKIVLSGWVKDAEKYIYGSLYLYDINGQVSFGWPISFRPKSANNAFNSDAQ